MKKILFCSSSIKTGKGGIASYAQDFISLFKYEFSFIVVTSDNGTMNDSDIPVFQINMDDWSKKNAKQLLDIITKTSPDIIINSSFSLLSIISPFIPNNIKLITISHFTDGILAKYAGLNGDYVDSMIGLSTFAKSFLNEYSCVKDSSKIKVVYNYMPVDKDADLLSKIHSSINIVYPGGTNYQKSADVVCKSILKLLKTDIDFKLYWIGNSNIVGHQYPFVHTKSLDDILPRDNRIIKLGPVSREEAKNILLNANIFVLPSRGEGFPISLIEAMRGYSIPVISNAKHGALDLIKDKENGFIVKQDNAEDLYLCLVNILKNHFQYKCIYENSYQTYKKYLTPEVWKSKMSEIFNEDDNHKKRVCFDGFPLLYWKGVIKLRYAIYKFKLFEILIKHISMMLKFRYIRYVYRNVI